MHNAVTTRAHGRRSRKLSATPLVATAALVVLAIVLLGCGSDDGNGDNGDSDAFAPQVVRDSDIEAQESGSPERALLEWWQAVQFQDAPVALDRTSEETIDELGQGHLRELIATRGPGFQGIEVLSASEDGDTASVRAGLLTFQPDEPGGEPPSEPTASRPVTFTMISEDGGWLFAQTDYLEPMVEDLKQSKREQEEEQPTEEEPTEEEPAE